MRMLAQFTWLALLTGANGAKSLPATRVRILLRGAGANARTPAPRDSTLNVESTSCAQSPCAVAVLSTAAEGVQLPAARGAMRPTTDELEVARAYIVRMKAADSTIKRVDELLVCAAVACRAGEFGGVPTACGRAIGKTVASFKAKQVTYWVAWL